MRSPVSIVIGFRFDLHRGTTYVPHRHRAVEIVLHVAGSGTIHFAGQDAVPFAAGDASICPPNLVHHQAMHDRGTDWCLLLSLRPELFAPITRPYLVRGALSPALVQEIGMLTDTTRATEPMARLEVDLRAATVLAGVLARARPCTADAMDAHASLAQSAAQYMAERLATLSSLADVARAFSVSPSHLRRQFAEFHGIAPLQWLIRRRIDRAKDLLAHSSLPLRDVASACGFTSEQYLCAVFHRVEGRAPGCYRT
jgi:AraC-like DNA-binding protein